MTKVDLIEGLIYVDFGTFDNWNSFKPKVELWNEYKSSLGRSLAVFQQFLKITGP